MPTGTKGSAITQAVAIVAMLHGVVGLVFAGWGVVLSTKPPTFSDVSDPERLCDSADRVMGLSREECRQLASRFDASRMRDITSSRPYRAFLWSFVALSMMFDLGLLLASGRLLRAENAGAVRLFVGLMIVFAVYTHVLPAMIPEDEQWSVPFGAAWGVGNMGLGLMLITRIWLWGPIALVLAVAPWRRREPI
jgi:hypothetical protein